MGFTFFDAMWNSKDIEKIDFDSIVDGQYDIVYDDYRKSFLKEKNIAIENQNESKAYIFETLQLACSYHFNPESDVEPFAAMLITNTGRSAIPDDFDDEQLKLIEEIIPKITEADLKARLADILWLRKRDFEYVEIAAENYIKSADILFGKEVIHSIDRLERALRLTAKLGKGAKKLFKDVATKMETYAIQLDEEHTFSILRILKLLHHFRLGDEKQFVELSKKLAENAESQNDWRKSRECWEVNAEWNRRSKNDQLVKKALIKSAKTHIKEADFSQSKMVEASFLQKAIIAHRRVGGLKKEVSSLHERLLKVQSGINCELGSVESDYDISELVERARNLVKGKSFRDTIFSFCKELRPLNFEIIKERTEEIARKNPISFMVSGVVVDEEGKTVAHYPNLMVGNEQEREIALLAHIHKQAEHDVLLAVYGIIEPIRKQVLIEHNVRESDFLDVVRSSPIVPPGREYFFARALYKGFTGDFVSSTDTLVTQFEHSMRYVLKSHGIITSGIDDNNTQDDRSLNTTLVFKEVDEIFGIDIAFSLRNILINRFGGNLRNKIAHGLMWPSSYFTQYPIYFWAFVLRLVVWPILVDFYKSDDDGPQE